MTSESLENGSKNYLPIKEASKLVSYSRDYVAKLAREQKILAKQESRQWFIEVDSLKNFAFLSECEQKIRSQRLSAERKREQQIKKEIESISFASEKKLSTLPVRVATRLIGTVFAGLFLGVLFSQSSLIFDALNSKSLSASLDYAVNQVFNLDFGKEEYQQNTDFFVTKDDNSFSDTEVVVNPITPEGYQGVLILTPGYTPSDSGSVQELFSDPVQVEMFSDTDGRVSLPTEGIGSSSKSVDFSLVQIPKVEKVNTNDYEI